MVVCKGDDRGDDELVMATASLTRRDAAVDGSDRSTAEGGKGRYLVKFLIFAIAFAVGVAWTVKSTEGCTPVGHAHAAQALFPSGGGDRRDKSLVLMCAAGLAALSGLTAS